MQIFRIEKHFSKDEFILMCSILNGVLCSSETFVANILGGIEYENTSDIDEEVFLEKLHNLNEEEIDILYIKISEFWDSPIYSFITEDRLFEIGLDFNE